MKILYLTSEVYPLIKTGGLADVSLSLPREIQKSGHDIRLSIPFYGPIKEEHPHSFEYLKTSYIYFRSEYYAATIFQGFLPSTSLPLYLIDSQQFFNRPGIYNENGIDYPDNCLRFAFYCMQSLQMLKLIDFKPDIIHCNDWHAALAIIYLKTVLKDEEFFKDFKSLFTIHNISYQGIFSPDKLPEIGLDERFFTLDCLEYWNNINLMKGGIILADAINTVSPTYCKEIQTEEFGFGLEGVIQENAHKLHGILNGADYSLWSPEKDPYIAQPYDTKKPARKKENKKDLQKELGLKVQEDIPVIGMVTRIIQQKGFDIIIPILETLLQKEDIQLVILGSGDEKYEQELEEVQKKHGNKFIFVKGYKNALSHRIEAGADIFLMPSAFEPSGLNQMYSLKYGTIPVVRKIGGLNDTIVPCTPANMKKGRANGFMFSEYSSDKLLKTIKKALHLYRNDSQSWKQLMKNAMKYDFSWKKSAEQYIKIYNKLLQGRT